MGWKKDLKKKFNDRKTSIFDYSDGETSIIIWEKSNGTISSLSLEQVLELNDKYKEDLRIETSFFQVPLSLKAYSYVLNSIGTSEYFQSYLTNSDFENTYNVVKEQTGEYAANIIILMLNKWNFFTQSKFWKVFNSTFSVNQSNAEKVSRKVFEAMKLTSLEAINEMLEKALEQLDLVEVLDPYKHYLMIEEIIDQGEEFTWHWSKMLDNVIDAAVTSLYDETSTFDYYGNDDTLEYGSTFEDFFEKTKTMALNSELEEAFEYFGISYQTDENEFKKIYRTLAKQYHPDVNKDKGSAVEMKKINVYKTVVDGYFERLGG